MFLNTLSDHLSNKYSRTGAIADLDEAIRVRREAINTTPVHDLQRVTDLFKLGRQVDSRYSITQAIADLEELIRIMREAVEQTSQDYPDRAGFLNSLGNALGDKYSRIGATADLKEAILCHQLALRQLNSPTMTRIVASREVLEYCAIISDWQQAYEAADIGVHLIPTLMSQSLGISDKQFMLGQMNGLASNAAAAALHAGRGALVALNFLEQGRGVVAASLEDMRTETLHLQERYPELAERMIRLRDEIELPLTPNTSVSDENREPSWQDQASRRYKAYEELDKVTVEIREQPEFKDFLLVPSVAQMHIAASHGPTVVLNVSQYRCDAILVEQHQIRSLALPQLNSMEVMEKSSRDDLGSPQILEWLWDVIANPVLDALGYTQPPSDENWPHIWWITVGPLSIFPLHAAGRHVKGSTETVLDRVISSYSSSVKSIIHGRSRHDPEVTPSAPAQALLVAMEHTPGNSSLHFAPKEVAVLHGLCKSMALTPTQPGRRKQDVISHLPHSKIFHFAGHGHTGLNDPSKSCLLLEDGESDPLTVANLLEMNIRQRPPFLAYLSACRTGQNKDDRMVDESINLVSAFQLAGFRHVIGTLWTVNDDLCMEMARITYESMRDGGMTDESVSRGLHNAARELRHRWLESLDSTMPAKARRRGGRLLGKEDVLVPLMEEVQEEEEEEEDKMETRGGSGDGHHHSDSNALLLRDADVSDDDDDDGGGGDDGRESLPWVQYVHFGL